MYSNISIFSVGIPTFNLFVGCGMLASLIYILSVLKKLHLPHDRFTDIVCAFPFAFIFCVCFAHIFDAVAHYGVGFLLKADFFKVGGISFLGGLIGGILYLYIHSLILKIDFLYLLNLFLPAMAIAQAFGRIGCFFGGCCFGMPCAVGFVYPPASLPFEKYADIPVFPIQLFESAWLFALFFYTANFVRFCNRAGVYLVLMTSARFVLEFFRGDNRGSFGTGFSPSQIASMILFLFGVFLLNLKDKKGNICKTMQPKR